MRRNKLFLGLFLFIVIIAVFLRFYSLGANPPSLTWDEASWGYNAYSLGIDGREEFGKFLPVTYLESFGDFKPPVYAYLDIIPVKIFGLNEFATRFPSALFGVLTVITTYFLVKRLFKNHNKSQHEHNDTKYEVIALLASFFLAISPWHIMLSRAAFEANVATFFIVFGVYAFFVGIQDKKWYLIAAAVSFALSIYTFNTSRVVSPLLVLILAVCFRNTLFKQKKETLIAAFTGIILVAPVVPFLLSPQAGLRFREVNIFSDPGVVKSANQEIANDNNAAWSKVIHNRRFLYGLEYVKHYFDNITPNFLFFSGDGNPKFSTQNTGQMYMVDILFLVAGTLLLFRKREGNWWFIPVWLLLGIIPAASARETPHALRIETTLPTFQILAAYGAVGVLGYLNEIRYKIYKINFGKLIICLMGIFMLFNFIYFYHDLMTNYKYDYSEEWQYGYSESINYVKSVEANYDIVQVTQALGRPYIYYLFYTQTPPSEFRSEAIIHRDAFGFVDVQSFGKYTFPKDYNYNSSKNKKVLYINSPYNLPTNIKILKTFYSLGGKPVLVAYTI